MRNDTGRWLASSSCPKLFLVLLEETSYIPARDLLPFKVWGSKGGVERVRYIHCLDNGSLEVAYGPFMGYRVQGQQGRNFNPLAIPLELAISEPGKLIPFVREAIAHAHVIVNPLPNSSIGSCAGRADVYSTVPAIKNVEARQMVEVRDPTPRVVSASTEQTQLTMNASRLLPFRLVPLPEKAVRADQTDLDGFGRAIGNRTAFHVKSPSLTAMTAARVRCRGITPAELQRG
jgi:hypothetical protein